MATPLLTTKQAASLLGVSASFLEKDRWAGSRIPFVWALPILTFYSGSYNPLSVKVLTHSFR